MSKLTLLDGPGWGFDHDSEGPGRRCWPTAAGRWARTWWGCPASSEVGTNSIWTGLTSLGDRQARAKVRASHVRLVFAWSSADLRLIS